MVGPHSEVKAFQAMLEVADACKDAIQCLVENTGHLATGHQEVIQVNQHEGESSQYPVYKILHTEKLWHSRQCWKLRMLAKMPYSSWSKTLYES